MIRPATTEDASSLAAVGLEVWIATYQRQGVSGFFADYALGEFTPARFLRDMAAPDTHLWVSQNTQGIDGFLRLCTASPAPVPGGPICEIATLYVQPRHHGRGTGNRLLQVALAHCRGAGYPSVWLSVNCENTAALGFYQHHGFDIIGETHFAIQSESYANHVLRLRLPAA